MGSQKITYAGVIGSAAGFVGIMGLAVGWFTDGVQVVQGTADTSGTLAFVMSAGLFVFGAAYLLMSDPGIRRAMGALITLCAVLLIVACLWGQQRADQLLAGGGADNGLLLSGLGGLLGICAGLLALQASMKADVVREPAAVAAE